MSQLDDKINQHFEGMVVRKDLVKAVKGNAIVPTYVLEYLLGQYCATSDTDSIHSGIETVKGILAQHYVHRNEAGLTRSLIREKGRHKVIDKISVALNDKDDVYEATFANLGIKKVLVHPDTVKKHPKLLVSGVWCIADVEYRHSEENRIPWLLESLKPIQLSAFDFDQYVAARERFTTDEWIDVLIQSIGFNPDAFGRRSKLLQLVRLIPFCERNYNVIELGPKGTGKSHIYSEFSPHGMLISGGEITVPKLFVENRPPYKIGLVGYWDCVAFDEFAGTAKRVDKALVDIMKNYMANKSFSRGIETLGAEASMAFVGNTRHTVPYMLRHSDLFDELPDKYHDSAFLDRLHFYIPGWEVDILRGEMFTDGFGFVVDYLAEILRSQRNYDFSQLYAPTFSLSEDISTRDRDAIHKTFSGLMKILFPNRQATEAETEELLRFAIEGRKRIKDQLFRIDATYPPVRFAYVVSSGVEKRVKTLEEEQYPSIYYPSGASADQTTDDAMLPADAAGPGDEASKTRQPTERHLGIHENQRGISFDNLFGPYLKGARKIVVTDPYIRLFYQARNLMDFLETIVKTKSEEEEVEVHLLTVSDEFRAADQESYFEQMQKSVLRSGIKFTWEYDRSETIHARHIVTDHGWKILLDRGLDVFQQYDMKDAFSLANRLQQYRACKAFEVTFIKHDRPKGA